MFETFNVPAFYVSLDATLALHSAGRSTAMVVSINSVTNVVPFYEGYSLPHAIRRLDIGMLDIADYMIKILRERGYTGIDTVLASKIV